MEQEYAEAKQRLEGLAVMLEGVANKLRQMSAGDKYIGDIEALLSPLRRADQEVARYQLLFKLTRLPVGDLRSR